MVSRSSGAADLAVARRDSQRVELAAWEEPLVGHAGVDLEADQIAVSRCSADANKCSETLRRRVGTPPQHLIDYHIEPEIAAAHGRDAAHRRVGERPPPSCRGADRQNPLYGTSRRV
jgi:hypothetical protein